MHKQKECDAQNGIPTISIFQQNKILARLRQE